MKSLTKKIRNYDLELYRERVFIKNENPLYLNCECYLCLAKSIFEEETGEEISWDPHDPDIAVCLARCANWRAKYTLDYDLKVGVFVAAALLPATRCGWGDDSEVFFLKSQLGPAATAHDPYDQLSDTLPGRLCMPWKGEWDGIRKQPFAWQILKGIISIKKRKNGFFICEKCDCPRIKEECQICRYNACAG